MNENIKALIIRFLINLKKYWYIGFACVILAITLVCFTSLGADEQLKTNANGVVIGTNSITKITWDFETEENLFLDGAALETQIAVAKTNLDVLLKIAKSGYVVNVINVEMQEAGYGVLSTEDIYEIEVVGHNFLDIRVYGTNAERVKFLENLLRAELFRIVRENFSVVSTSDVLKPMLFYADNTVGYELTSQPYEATDETINVDEVGTKKNVFTMNNILIVVSSVMLWLAIVLLLTISDGKIYTERDIEDIGIVCFGQISKDKNRNRQIFSIINKRVSDEKKNSIQMLVFGEKNYLPEIMLNNDVIIKEKNGYSYWSEEGVEKIDTRVPVLFVIHVGKYTSDEIEKGLKALEILGAECIGGILFL